MASGPDLPATEDAAVRWLQARGGAADQALADRASVLDLSLVARDHGLTDALFLDRFFAVFQDAGTLRKARTTARSIGALSADLARLEDHARVWRPLRFRVALAVVIVAAGLGIGANPGQIAVLCLMVPFLGRRTLIATVLAGAAVALGVSTWWYCLIALIGLTAAAHARALVALLRRTWTEMGPYLGFLPVRLIVELALRGKLSAFATALDLSGADNSDVAGVFLDACGAVPGPLVPVLDICRAGVAVQQGDLVGAAVAAGQARAAAQAGPPGVAGWCALRLAAVLLTSGRDADARTALVEAGDLLRGRRARRWRAAAELQLLDLDVRRPDADLAGLLARIHRLRLIGTRRHLVDLVVRTETWLARLMLAHGSAGFRWTVNRIAGSPDGRGEVDRTREETAAGLLLRAAAQVDDPAVGQKVDADAQSALALVDARRRPLAAVQARVVLAQLREREGQLPEAMAHAAAALTVANRARYKLPSGRWRAEWSVRQLDVFATALRLADALGDSAFVAEAIELARGEVLPTAAAGDSGLLSLLDVSARQPVPSDLAEAPQEDADAAFALAGFSPVARPPVARIRSARHSLGIEEGGAGTFDLERELVATAGRCWYWTAVIVAARYHWAVRDPAGRWSHGATDLSPGTAGATALSDLAAALPIARPGESAEAAQERVLAGPLGRSERPAREYELLLAVSEAVLPDVLREGLRAGGDPSRKLVVSLPAALAHLPVGWLPLSSGDDLRVLETAVVVHLPSWAIVTKTRPRGTRALRADWPMRLGLINPGASEDIVVMREPPPVAQVAVTRPMAKPDVRLALDALSADGEWLLYLAGHVVSDPENASLHGLELDGDRLDGLLTVRDVVATDADGSSRYPVPARVLSVGCDTMGVSSSARRDGAPVNEWLGFGAALLLAGADGLCCTAYTVFEGKALLAITKTLADALVTAPDAGVAVAGVQRLLLERWRRTGRGLPVLWQSFVYIGQE
ncbi:hypothetical protein [Amycolatopsis jejuensis]|uniref:hypothetical protein n=1 Tax=Amycolatopsis jejuensis TaxID=330084 RepID=UPI000525122C|nr:hypothetical protein [Amycolatopsis jejuensis]